MKFRTLYAEHMRTCYCTLRVKLLLRPTQYTVYTCTYIVKLI
jgi:hypothetical protein